MEHNLSADRIRAGLTTSVIGRSLVYLSETSSTNDDARRLANAGGVDGLLVITDHQTAGKGRLQRRWVAPPGSSLLMSLLLRPAIQPVQAQQLTMMCGLAVCDAIEAETGLRVGLKWPNDVVVGGAKLGGILTEIEVRDDKLDFAIVGIGLNVNLNLSQLPRELLMRATSLSSELGRAVSRLQVLWAFLGSVEERYFLLEDGQSPHVEWSQRLTTLGQPVTVTEGKRSFEGVAQEVDHNGALLVRQASGEMATVLAGDVTLRFGQTGLDLL
jgi:BirA family biotin operon repressor/biotin-[acetyl-CoA-carboxylase] ligase